MQQPYYIVAVWEWASQIQPITQGSSTAAGTTVKDSNRHGNDSVKVSCVAAKTFTQHLSHSAWEALAKAQTVNAGCNACRRIERLPCGLRRQQPPDLTDEACGIYRSHRKTAWCGKEMSRLRQSAYGDRSPYRRRRHTKEVAVESRARQKPREWRHVQRSADPSEYVGIIQFCDTDAVIIGELLRYDVVIST